MYNCSVLRVLLILIFILSGWVKGNLQISKHQQNKNHSTKASHGSQQRVKRGWIWSQIFVEEEDPTVRKIGQVQSKALINKALIAFMATVYSVNNFYQKSLLGSILLTLSLTSTSYLFIFKINGSMP